MIRQAEVEAESTFKVDTIGEPTSRLVFSVSKSLEIASVSYDGDLQLSWSDQPARSDRRRLIEVALPRNKVGRRHTVRVRGFVLSAPRGGFALPQLVLQGATLKSGRVTIAVESPLILRSFRGQGIRQTQPIWESESAQHLVLNQFVPNASILVNVGVPRTDLRATALTHVTLGPQRWQLSAEVEWTCKSGVVFSAECQLPPEWEITDVRMRQNLLGNDLVNWSIRAGGEAPILHLQFRDALSPGAAKGVVILAKRLSAAPNIPVHLPAVIPLGCDEFDSAIVLTYDPDHAPAISSETDFETTDLDSLALKWKGREVWKQIESAQGMRQIVLRALGPINVGVFTITGEVFGRPAVSSSETGGIAGRSTDAGKSPDFSRRQKVSTFEDSRTGPPSSVRDEGQAGSASEGQSTSQASPQARLVRIAITSRFPVAERGQAQHEAVVRLVNWREGQGVSFRLAPFSKLIGVMANGQPVSTGRDGETYFVPPLRAGVLRTLTIRYTTTTQSRLLQTRFLVDVPRLEEQVVEVSWRAVLSRQFELGRLPASLCPRTRHRPTPWTVRFFGPMGRPTGSAVFNPASWTSWKQLVSEALGLSARSVWSAAEAADRAMSASGNLPVRTDTSSNIREYHATAPFAIEWFEATCWHTSRLRALAWAVFWLCLGLGVGLRRLRWKRAGVWLASFGVAGATAGACVLPSPIVELAGASLAGILLAVFTPDAWLRCRVREKSTPSGGTTTVPLRALPAGLFLVIAILLSRALAGEAQRSSVGTGAPRARPATKAPAGTAPSTNGTVSAVPTADDSLAPNVLVPVRERLTEPSALVYVDAELYQQLVRAAKGREHPSAYLLAGADYRAEVDSSGFVTLRARVEVRIARSDEPVEVYLPLTGVNLGAETPCRVNGRPCLVAPAHDR
ncbi:MAG: hypothetical protein GXP27_01520, partial [Planctomycetes bacterium]|nr:hypothetical protein [Planctomycetota bacterium]